MGFLNKIKSMVSTEKDYDDGVYPVSDDGDYAEPVISSRPSSGVGLSSAAIEMKVVRPERYEDGNQIADHLHDNRDDPRSRIRNEQHIQRAVLRENAEDPHDSRSDRSDDGQNHRHRRASHTAQGSREEVHDAAEEIRNRRDRQNFHTAADNLRVPGVNLQDFRTEQIRAATHHQCDAAGENQAVDQHLIHSFVFSDTVVLACEAHARLGDGVD